MTVRQYAQYEREKDFKYLFIRFSWLPLWIVKRQIEKFTESFNKLFSPEQAGELYRNIDKLLFQNKLIIMQTLLDAIRLHLTQKAEIDILKKKLKLPIEPDNALAEYIKQVEYVCGIEIKTLDDVNDFRDQLEHDIDKFIEMFADKKPVKGVTIMELFYLYCSVMEINPDYTDMRLTEFAELKHQAEEKSKRMQEQLSKK
jgi:hypothetical protein